MKSCTICEQFTDGEGAPKLSPGKIALKTQYRGRGGIAEDTKLKNVYLYVRITVLGENSKNQYAFYNNNFIVRLAGGPVCV